MSAVELWPVTASFQDDFRNNVELASKTSDTHAFAQWCIISCSNITKPSWTCLLRKHREITMSEKSSTRVYIGMPFHKTVELVLQESDVCDAQA
jgi:hypothetical protein